MLGAGCPFRDRCEKYKKATKWHKDSYCDNPRGCEQCGERPKNYNNQQVQQNYKASEEGAGIGALLILGLIIFGALKLFGVI